MCGYHWEVEGAEGSDRGNVSWTGKETGWQLGRGGEWDRLGFCRETVRLDKKRLGQEMTRSMGRDGLSATPDLGE